jgi:hypothetical protein
MTAASFHAFTLPVLQGNFINNDPQMVPPGTTDWAKVQQSISPLLLTMLLYCSNCALRFGKAPNQVPANLAFRVNICRLEHANNSFCRYFCRAATQTLLRTWGAWHTCSPTKQAH